jgi:hypothetical protein
MPWFSLRRRPLKGLKVRPRTQAFVPRADLSVGGVRANRLAEVCQKGWTVWDCGSGIGYSTLLFSKFVGEAGTVIAFEPDRLNFMRSYDNATLNGCFNIFFVCAAVAARKPPKYPARGFTLAQAISNAEFPRPNLIRLDGNDTVATTLREAHLADKGPAPLLLIEFKKAGRATELWQFAAENGYGITWLEENRPLTQPTSLQGTLLLKHQDS